MAFRANCAALSHCPSWQHFTDCVKKGLFAGGLGDAVREQVFDNEFAKAAHIGPLTISALAIVLSIDGSTGAFVTQPDAGADVCFPVESAGFIIIDVGCSSGVLAGMVQHQQVFALRSKGVETISLQFSGEIFAHFSSGG